MKILRKLLLFLFICFLFYNPAFSKDKPIIAVSINPIKLIVKEIVKDKMEIYTIVPPGASPHTFQLTIKNRIILKKADALFLIGANLENWLGNLEQEFKEKNRLFVFSKHIDNFLGKKPYINPHIWLSIRRILKVLPFVKNKIIEIDKKNKDFYISNYNNFILTLNNMDKKISEISKSLKNKNIVVLHPVWNYFLKDYNFNVIANIENKAGETPTLKKLIKIITLIKKYNVQIIIIERDKSLKWVKTIEKQTNAKTVILDPLGFDSSIKTYKDLILLNFNEMVKNLL